MVKKTNLLKKRKNMSKKKKSYPRKLHHKRSLAKKNKSKKLHRKISYRKKRSYRKRKFKGGMNIDAAQAMVQARARAQAQEDARTKALEDARMKALEDERMKVLEDERMKVLEDAGGQLLEPGLTRQRSPSSPVPSPEKWTCPCGYENHGFNFDCSSCKKSRESRGPQISPESSEHHMLLSELESLRRGGKGARKKTMTKQKTEERIIEITTALRFLESVLESKMKRPVPRAASEGGGAEKSLVAGGGGGASFSAGGEEIAFTAIAGSDAKEGATESAAAAVGGFGDPYYLYQQSLNSMEVKLNLLLQNKNRTDENFYEYQKKITEIITLLKSISNAPSDKIELWMTKNGRPKLLVKLLSSINLDIHGDPK